MPKKLTILGALTAALVFGYFGLFNGTSQGAIQTFTTSGATAFDWDICYGGSYPVPSGGGIACGAGSSNTTVPRNTSLISYSNIEIPPGSRLSLPITYSPSDGITEWQADTVTCTAGANNACTAAAVSGDVTSRTDLGCDLGQDILASNTGQTGGLPGTWPNKNEGAGPGWNPPDFIRTSQSAALPGGGTGAAVAPDPNAYVTQIVPFPTTGGNAFIFQSIDTANLDYLWIGGTAPLLIPGGPVLLQLATYQSSYASQTGLNASVALLAGEPSNPPSDSFNCLDSPQDSVGQTNYLKTPDADRVIPRWNTTISAEDLQDTEIATILDWQCITVGAGEPDADGDCNPDAADTNDAVKDIDGDLVPDGVEVHAGSSPTVADTDGDGANDYTELIQFTNPAVADSDGDGQADAPDETPTNGAAAGTDAPTTGTDATTLTDDNCPAVSNASQVNTDSMFRFHGIAPSFTAPGNGTGDRSNPTEDRTGDACDTDNDNDDLNNVTEAGLRILPWSGFTDPGGPADDAATSVCAGPGAAGSVAPDTVMSPLDGDVDRDYFLDGRECQLRSRPDQSIRDNVLAENCNVAPTVPFDQGCAQPAGAAVGPGSGDEGDGLYLPGGGGASHLAIETFFRTRQVTTGAGVQNSDYDFPQPGCAPPLAGGDGTAGATGPGTGDRDSDRDFFCPSTGATAILLTDGVEVRIYGTSPNQFDSDQDACPDAEEVIDINGDGNTSSIDQGILGGKVLSVGGLDNNADGMYDDYAIGVNFDLNKDGTISSIDQGQLASLISSVGSCLGIGWEDNIDIGRATTNLP